MNDRTGPKILGALVVLAVLAAGIWYARGSGASDRRDASVPELAQASQEPPAVTVVDAGAERAAVLPIVAEESAESAPAPPVSGAGEPVLADARVRARFVDEVGQPWADVRFRQAREDGPSALSGPDGRAELVFPGKDRDEWVVQVIASRAGCASRSVRATLACARTVDLGELVLGPGARIVGHVLDARGAPLAEAKAGLSPIDYQEPRPERFRRGGSIQLDQSSAVRSDAQGGFVIEGAPVGPTRVWAHSKGHGYAISEPLEVRGGEDLVGVELRLPDLLKTDTITGRVVDPTGEPVPGAQVNSFGQIENESASRGDHADAEGRFEILLFLDSPTTLIASDPGEQWSDAAARGVLPGTRDLVLQLLEPRWIRLSVLGPAGEEVPGAKFTSMTGDGGSRQGREVLVKELGAGRYELRAPGTDFSLQVKAQGYLDKQTEEFEPAAVPAELVVRLDTAPILRGRVRAGGSSVAGAVIEAHAVRDGATTLNGFPCLVQPHVVGRAESDPDGSFEITLQSTQEVYVRASAPGWAPTLSGPHPTASGSAAAEIELTTGGVIEGRVRSKSGTSLPGAIVGITNGDAHPRTTRAGIDGTFRFDGLSPGSWVVLATDKEMRSDYTSISTSGVSPGEKPPPIEWTCEVVSGRTTYHDLERED